MPRKLIGTAPDQVPLNAYLGTMAFQSREAVSVDFLQVDSGTPNGVPYLSSSKVITTSSAFTFDGTTLTAAVPTSLGGLVGSESLRVVPRASANVYVQIQGGVQGTTRTGIGSVSPVAGTGFNIYNANSGAINFSTTFSNDIVTEQFRVAHVASAVNYVQVAGGATGGQPSISAQGSDTDINMNFASKNAGALIFATNGREGFRVGNSGTSVVNNIQVNGSIAGFGPVVQARGSDTDIDLGFTSKAAGSLRFYTNGQAQEQFRVAHTASAVNYVQVAGGATGSDPVVSAQGSDADRNLKLTPKGTGAVVSTSAFVAHSNATNYLRLRGGDSTGQSPLISTQGSDANISMVLAPKGTGAVNLAPGSSGVNISNGGTVTAITRTGIGSGYTSVPSVAITAPTTAGGVQATATATVFVGTATIASGGTGYTAGDVLTISGGTGTAGTLTASTVSAGVITAVTVTTGGSYSATPSNPVSVTGGTGSGATFNLTYGVNTAFTITNAGSGYVEQPAVTFSGGGGSGAAAYATVGSPTIIRSIGANSAQSMDLTGPSSASVPMLRLRDIAGADSWVLIQNGFVGTGFPVICAAGTANANLTVASNGIGSLNLATNGTGQTRQLSVAHTASAVNYVQVTGAVTSGNPTISAQGSDTNINLQLNAKGTGGVFTQFYHRIGTGYANYVQISGTTTGNRPVISVLGSDTDIDLGFTSKAAGSLRFYTNGNAQEQFRVAHTASAVNYVQVTGGESGAPVTISSQGADPVVNLRLSAKGAASIEAQVNNTTRWRVSSDGIFDSGMSASGGVALKAAATASQVNYVQVTGGVTTSWPIISAQGSDAVIGIAFQAKATGSFSFFSQGGLSARQFRIDGTNDSVNYLQVAGTTAGNPLAISAMGSDTNIDLILTPKGTGSVKTSAALVATGGISGGTF